MIAPIARIRLGAGIAVVALVALLAACSEAGLVEPPDPDPGPEPRADVNGYVQSLPAWTEVSPLLDDRNEATGSPVAQPPETIGDTIYTCETTPFNLTRTPHEIITYSPNASVFWLGNLIQGRSYADGFGSLRELSIRERAPLRLSIDLLTGDNFAVVDDPSLTSVQAAIGELIQRATDAGHRGGSDASFTLETTHSLSQASLELGFSARFLGAEASGGLEYENSVAETTVTAHFVQRLFTVAIELPAFPEELFSDELTEERLQQHIDAGNLGPENLPVYIANIAFGRILTFNFTSSDSENRIRAAISGSYNGLVGGGGGYTETELRQTLSSARLSVAALGGESADIQRLIRDGDLRSYFVGDPALTSARPISYQLNNLADNTVAQVSETASYNLRECSTEPVAPRVYDYQVRLSNIDDGVKVFVNGIQIGRNLYTLDDTVNIDENTLPDSNVTLRILLGNSGCGTTRLDMHILVDGVIRETRGVNYFAGHCGYTEDWQYTINKATGVLTRIQ